VVVMTPQPGRIAADLAITLERPRTQALDQTSQFTDLVLATRNAMGGRR